MTTQTEDVGHRVRNGMESVKDAPQSSRVGTDDVRRQGKRALESAEDIPSSVYLGFVGGSIVLSALLFVSGKKNLGQFVGLWAPTILNLAIFTKRLRPSNDLA